MIKVSIDLLDSRGEGGEKPVPEQLLEAVVSGCQQSLKRLGKLGETIEVFRVEFICYGLDLIPGPRFKIYFHDPLGEECSHSFEYRLVGRWNCNPSSEKIAEAICTDSDLPRVITEHFMRCAQKIKCAQTELEVLMLDRKPKMCIDGDGTECPPKDLNVFARKKCNRCGS